MFGGQSMFKPEGKKLRRKLQKLNHRGSLQPAAKSTVQFNEPPSTGRISFDVRHKAASQNNLPRAPSPSSPLLVIPPDLSDAKWQEYVRQSRYQVQPMTKEPVLQTSVIPEFAHLSVDNLSPLRRSTDTGSRSPDAVTVDASKFWHLPAKPKNTLQRRRSSDPTPRHTAVYVVLSAYVRRWHPLFLLYEADRLDVS